MHTFYVEKSKIKNGKVEIEGEENRHLFSVLRLRTGEQIAVICGDENKYIVLLEETNKNFSSGKIQEVQKSNANPKVNVTLFQGLPKGEKFELIVQKCSELGVSEVVPFESTFCVAKKSDNLLPRLKKVAIESAKQCGRTKPLEIGAVCSLEEMIEKFKSFDYVLFAYEKEDKVKVQEVIKNAKNVAIVVGSEGGFSPQEEKQITDGGALSVSLGTRILRTETASIVLSALVCFGLGV